MHRIVCKCINVNVADVLESASNQNIDMECLVPEDIESIHKDTGIGIGCRQCLRDECSKIDIDIFDLGQEMANKV